MPASAICADTIALATPVALLAGRFDQARDGVAHQAHEPAKRIARRREALCGRSSEKLACRACGHGARGANFGLAAAFGSGNRSIPRNQIPNCGCVR